MLSSELVRSVLDSAPDAMIIIDAGGTILFANRQVQPMFGYAPPEIVGARVEVLMPERFRVKHTGHREGYGRNGRVRNCQNRIPECLRMVRSLEGVALGARHSLLQHFNT